MEVGGWVQVTRNFVTSGKSSQNSPKPVVIFWRSIPCVFCLYALLKVVGYYDFECSVHVSGGFPKKVWMEGGWVGGVSSIQFFFGFLDFFNFAKPLTTGNSK